MSQTIQISNKIFDERPRIEIRVDKNGTQVLAKTLQYPIPLLPYNPSMSYGEWHQRCKEGSKHGYETLKISANGAMHFTKDEWNEFKKAVDDAIAAWEE